MSRIVRSASIRHCDDKGLGVSLSSSSLSRWAVVRTEIAGGTSSARAPVLGEVCTARARTCSSKKAWLLLEVADAVSSGAGLESLDDPTTAANTSGRRWIPELPERDEAAERTSPG